MIRLHDGRTFSGTELQVVRNMRELAFRESQDLPSYISWVVEQTLEFEGKALKVVGDTDDELARSLIDELVRVGLASR
jgi:hypothetical protein